MWGVSTVAPFTATAQPFTYRDCVDDGSLGDACSDVSVGDRMACGGQYESFRGRLAWPPLRFVAPITIEIHSVAGSGARFPLYLELLVLEGRDPTLGYCDGPGQVLASIAGREDCGSDVFGPFDLTSFGVGLNETYAVRVHFLGDVRARIQSPFFRCIRVEPVAGSPVAATNWGRMKRLYQ
jgi:hypothetical protein